MSRESGKQARGKQPKPCERRSVLRGAAALTAAFGYATYPGGGKGLRASDETPRDRVVSIGAFTGNGETDDAADAFDRAKAHCRSSGARRIDFPPGRYRTSRPLVIDLPGLIVTGTGATLVLASQGPSVFELTADDARIIGFRIVGEYRRGLPAAAGDAFRRDAGIACYDCHRYEIRDVAVRNFQAGIYASGWRKGGPDGKGTGVFQVGGIVKDVSFDACDFGLIYGVQDEFSIENLSCRNTTKIVGYEPHAIYATNAFGAERTEKATSDAAGSGGSGHVRVINASSDANLYDSCFKFKAHRRLIVAGLHGRDSRILVQFTGCPDLRASDLTLERQRAWLNETGGDIVWLDGSGKRRQSTAPGQSYARTGQAIALGFCDRAQLSDISIDQADGYGGPALKLSFSAHATVDGLSVRTRRRDRSGDHLVTLNDGSDHAVFRKFAYRDLGAGDEEVFSFSDSSDGLVDRPNIVGSSRYGIMIGASSGNRLLVASAAEIGGNVWRTAGDGHDNVVAVSGRPQRLER